MEPLSFYVHRVLNELKTKRLLMECAEDLEPKDKDGEHNAEPTNATKPKPGDRAKYVDQRLREIERFERGYERKSR